MSTITVKMQSEYRANDDEPLTASSEFTDWVKALPGEAVLSPSIVEKGNQRDPWPVLVGMVAKWEEER